jgi:hypothetical protein
MIRFIIAIVVFISIGSLAIKGFRGQIPLTRTKNLEGPGAVIAGLFALLAALALAAYVAFPTAIFDYLSR